MASSLDTVNSVHVMEYLKRYLNFSAFDGLVFDAQSLKERTDEICKIALDGTSYRWNVEVQPTGTIGAKVSVRVSEGHTCLFVVDVSLTW